MIISLRTECSEVFLRSDLDRKNRISKAKKEDLYDLLNWKVGNDLFFRSVSRQVFSALKVLTSVFGMRTGGTLSLKSPTMVKCLYKRNTHNYIFSTRIFRIYDYFRQLIIDQALNLLVPVSYIYYYTSTSGLSTL